MITTVTNNDLSAAKAAPVAVVDFNATWCGPCKMLAPVMEDLSEEMAGQVQFFACDVDDNPALAQQFGISSIPAIAVLKNGEMVDGTVGFQPKPGMEAFIRKNL